MDKGHKYSKANIKISEEQACTLILMLQKEGSVRWSHIQLDKDGVPEGTVQINLTLSEEQKIYPLESRIADLSLQVESKDDIISTLQKKFEIDEDEMENILNEQ